jgi:hypothetical protein
MTKNEIIRELRSCRVDHIEHLFIVYHNRQSPRFTVKYVFSYENTSDRVSTYGERRELGRVLLSIYRLRGCVDCMRLAYRDYDGSIVDLFYDSNESNASYVHSVSDFIKIIKK